MSDLISRQAAIDIERNATVDTNPSHFEAHQKFTQFMDDAEISSFGRWQWSNGFNTALTAVGIDLKKLPSAQPNHNAEPGKMVDDTVSRQAAMEMLMAQNVIMDGSEYHNGFNAGVNRAQEVIRNLPSVQPKRGTWIERESDTEDKENGFETVIVCSCCDFPATTFYSEDCESRTQIRTDFCPNCGADMRGKSDADNY